MGVDAARPNAWRMLQRSEKGSQFIFIKAGTHKDTNQRKQFLALVLPTEGRIVSNDIRYDSLHYWPEELRSRPNRSKQYGSRKICPATNTKF